MSWLFHHRVSRSILLVLAGLTALPASAQTPTRLKASPADIQEISVERGCFGCATGSNFSLRRNGTAEYTLTGNARHDTTGQSFSGKISKADFDRLAALITSRRFFDLAGEYSDPHNRDGEWATTTVTLRNGTTHRVQVLNQPGPRNLQKINNALEDTRQRIGLGPHNKTGR